MRVKVRAYVHIDDEFPKEQGKRCKAAHSLVAAVVGDGGQLSVVTEAPGAKMYIYCLLLHSTLYNVPFVTYIFP